MVANYGVVQHNAVEKDVMWTRPPRRYRKLNVEASYNPHGSGAAGIVLCDDKGEAIASKACLLDNMMSVATVKAMTLLRGLEFLEQIGCSSAPY
jgi:hypothetical protein